VLLPTLTEEAISDNLDRRLKKGIIYTYIGNVLVSVNPFEQLPLYGSEWVQRYCGKMIYELPPHVYAIAEDSFR
jgi:myosin-1